MRSRVLLVLAAVLVLPLAAAATTPQDILLTRDGKPIAFGSGGSWKPARPGLTAALELIEEKIPDSRISTLNDQLQRAAERSLGSAPGILVALDPQTGEVLAFAANDDPVQPDIKPDIPRPPGSTFKIVTAAAALESGKFTAETVIPCPERLTLYGRTLRTFTGAAPEGLTLTEAFARSCNTSFGLLGLSVGLESLLGTAQSFGLEVTTVSDPSTSHVRRPTSPADFFALGAGISSVRLTPPALAAIAATVGNGGKRVQPRFYMMRSNRTRAVSADTAGALVSMMEAVVARGTGRFAAIEGARIAGKTGTVDRDLPEGKEIDDAWFVALAPSRGSRLAVAVVLPRAGFGGDQAAPLVRRFLINTRFYWDEDRL